MMFSWKRFVAAVGLLSLVACGGGGGDAGTSPIGGGGGGGTSKAEGLALTAGSATLSNAGGATVKVTATAVDKNRNAVAGIPITISVDNGGIATVSGAVTDAKGQVTADIGVGSDRTNRVLTVTATSGGLQQSVLLSVTGARLTSSALPQVVAGTAGNVIDYTLTDFNSVPMAGQDIAVSGNGLPSSKGTTDVNGRFRYTYDAPASPGSLEIVATAAGSQRTQLVTVSAANAGVPVAREVPQSASLTPTPSVVAPNSPGSSANQIELRALFFGANNSPIPNVRARFDLAGNALSTDGVISFVGSYAYSDESGVARATFTPGALPSPTNGVTVRVCYDVRDFALDACPHAALTTLTVASDALAVNIRANNQLEVGPSGLTYIKKFVVMVVDAAGQAKSGVVITPSVDLLRYYKGFYQWNGKLWVPHYTLAANQIYRWAGKAWELDPDTTGKWAHCPNEDVNRNAIREAGTYSAVGAAPAIEARGEDLNWNGDLEPRKSDVAIRMSGSNSTDASGTAIVQIEYGQSLASWLDYMITVTASGIRGTEARARFADTLPSYVPHLSDEKVAPPGASSPFGWSDTCLNAL